MIVGVALGEHLTIWAGVGIAIAIPAIALISRQTGGDADPGDRKAARAGMLYGSLTGVGFALLFIALDRRSCSSALTDPRATLSSLPMYTEQSALMRA